jgi:hypothetical protein
VCNYSICPVQVPYLPYPRYATVRQKLELFGRPLRNQQHPTIKVQTFIVKTSRSKWRRKVGWVPSHQQGMGNSFYLLSWGFDVIFVTRNFLRFLGVRFR